MYTSRFLAPLALATLGLATPAAAQITTTAPFVGAFTEEFETQSFGNPCVPGRVFKQHADLCTPGHSGCMITYGWLLYVGYAMYPHNGSNSFFGTTLGIGNLVFDTPVQRFGSYFGTPGYTAGGVARFYDAVDHLFATLPITAPRGGWAWNGWDAGNGGPKIKRVELVANDPYNGGSLICLDDAQMDISIGAYGTRATGCGGLAITASGNPSVGQQARFSLSPTASAAFLFGTPVTWPFAPCAPCLLGVHSLVNFAGSSLRIDIPSNASLIGLVFSVQGFNVTTGPCLRTVSLSDTVDARIG